MNSSRYTVIEINTTKIRLVVGYILDNKVYVLDAIESKVTGFEDGNIKDEEKVVSCLKELKKRSEENLKDIKYSISSCLLIVPPFKLTITDNKGATRTVNSSTVAPIDISNALGYASDVQLSPNQIVVDSNPLYYLLDEVEGSDTEGVRYNYPPLGKPAKKISVKVSLYIMPESLLNTYKQIMKKAKIQIEKIIPSPIATKAYLDLIPDKYPPNYFLLNIGEEISSIATILDYNIRASSVYTIFSLKKLNDKLNQEFGFTKEESDYYEVLFGLDTNPCFDYRIAHNVTISEFSSKIRDFINETINHKISDELKIIGNIKGNMALILIGQGSKLKGITYAFENMGVETFTVEINSLGARDIVYLPLLGAICYATKLNVGGQKDPNQNGEFNIVRD